MMNLLLLGLLTGAIVFSAEAAGSDRMAGIVSVASGRLNVRSAGSATASVVTTLNKGSYVTVLDTSDPWWKVEYAKGRYGYCHKDYISVKSASESKVSTQSGNLNVRSGAGASFSKTGSVAKGESVLILSVSGDWSRILYHGTQTGYVSSRYLSAVYPAVSLWVRSMKQMDERWADTKLAASGKTMAQIGCATTAIAMLESHRTGIVRYPDEMMTMLRYTPSGSVYWPAHYTAVTNTSAYLPELYKLLQRGKPVLFGATNAHGSQHWVVITGFTGGSEITAECFTIHDPGSYSRLTLQQFLMAYPNVYKYFYY